MFAVTGASGQLGRLVLDALMAEVEPSRIVALVRDPAKLSDYAKAGVTVRRFDYNEEESLRPALAGVERLLLVSGNEHGKREAQHRRVIDAARDAGVRFIAYTSILHADTSPLGLADDHRATEALIKQSGLDHALLRHGWYSENYAAGAAQEIKFGAVFGSSGDGRISPATRADFAAADAKILAGGEQTTGIFELAGDEAFSMTDYAAMLADVSGKSISYRNLPEPEYCAFLEKVGLPASLSEMLADSSAKAASGALFDGGKALSRLIGRPTVSMAETLARTVKE